MEQRERYARVVDPINLLAETEEVIGRAQDPRGKISQKAKSDIKQQALRILKYISPDAYKGKKASDLTDDEMKSALSKETSGLLTTLAANALTGDTKGFLQDAKRKTLEQIAHLGLVQENMSDEGRQVASAYGNLQLVESIGEKYLKGGKLTPEETALFGSYFAQAAAKKRVAEIEREVKQPLGDEGRAAIQGILSVAYASGRFTPDAVRSAYPDILNLAREGYKKTMTKKGYTVLKYVGDAVEKIVAGKDGKPVEQLLSAISQADAGKIKLELQPQDKKRRAA